MKLTGEEKRELLEGLLDAYPSRNTLAQLLALELDTSLDAIASDGPLKQAVFEVIVWAEAQGCTEVLIRKARRSNPGNRRLAEVASRLLAAQPQPEPLPNPLPPSSLTALRRAIVAAFDEAELAIVCDDVQEELRASGVVLQVSLETWGGTAKESKVLNLIRGLDRQGHLPVLVRVVRSHRPNLPV